MVRKAFARITRRAPRPQPEAPASASPQAQAAQIPPRQPAVRRQPQAASPHRPDQPGLITHLFRSRAFRSRFCRGSGNVTFTPGNSPGLTAAQCAFFNTPIEECDPEMLRQVFGEFARHIAGLMSPDSGMTDPEALFAALWSRIGGAIDAAPADAEPEPQPEAISGESAEDPAQQPPAAPEESCDAAPPESVESIANVAAAAAPDPTAQPAPARRRRLRYDYTLRYGNNTRLARASARPRPGRRRLPQRPPAWRFCYAACAGPP